MVKKSFLIFKKEKGVGRIKGVGVKTKKVDWKKEILKLKRLGLLDGIYFLQT